MTAHAGIGISDDHIALAETVQAWARRRVPSSETRRALEADREAEPEWWPDLAALGWLGIHLPESDGGSGYGIAELAVILERLGAACAPGPFLTTALAAAAIDRFVAAGPLRDLLAGLADGTESAGVGIGARAVKVVEAEGTVHLEGTWDVVLGGAQASILMLPIAVVPPAVLPTADSTARADTDGHVANQGRADQHRANRHWVVVRYDEVEVEELPGIDRTRRPARVSASGVALSAERILTCPSGAAGVEGLSGLLVAAEAVGVAAWCVDTAASYACEREQFGRPIGKFQAIKHRCADMLCTLEAARACVWDAAGALDRNEPGADLAVVVAADRGPEAAYRCAKDCLQVLGGIGFTWEHDVHLYLKRAMAMRLLSGTPQRWRRETCRLVRSGVRRNAAIELPPEAEAYRGEVRAFLDDLARRPRAEWDRRIGESGYLVAAWPKPWGRDASPLEQLVIDEEFRAARVRRPHLAVGAWTLPTIIAHGSPEQQRRFIPPTLRLELTWCQMFSEPAAGSDLAALNTKAVRTDNGWLLTGQKVWTSLAHFAQWGICLARTDPEAPKHDGIGCFLVDMASEGIDVRPLRELTGAEMFNEVFLDDVFVPDDCVVGEATMGWRVARTTLGNERVSMGSGSSMGPGMESLIDMVDEVGGFDDPVTADTLGDLIATSQALAALGTRTTLRALAGTAPGSDASVRKLLGVEHDQRVQEVAVELLGPTAATGDLAGALWVGGFLGNRSLSIAGGTSEIQRNVIAERLLGLPRDLEDGSG